MSETIRVSGKTLEDAITNATIQLGVTSDNIVYTVVEHESRGFLGIGQKDAVIEVRAKTEADFEAERIVKKAEEAVEPADENDDVTAESEEIKPDGSFESDDNNTSGSVQSEGDDESAENTDDDKKSSASSEERDEQEEFHQTQHRHHDREIKPLEHPEEAIAKAEEFLRNIYLAMGMNVELVSSYDGESLNIQMEGDDMGILIGKRGQTLDSLQYLVSLVVNKGSSSYVRVKLDTENYRERRRATLENLANNIAVKVKKSRQSVWLEPMNPYERRIIHSALQGDPFVTTYSEGEEPNRKVVVALKKDADLDALDRKYGERHSRRGYRGSKGKGQRRSERGSYRKNADVTEEDTEYIEAVEIPDIPSQQDPENGNSGE